MALPLPLQPDAGAAVRSRRHRDHDALVDGALRLPPTHRTGLAGHPTATTARWTGPPHREPALPEADLPAAVALGTGSDAGARSGPRATAGGTGLRHRDRDRHLAAQGRHAEGNLHRELDRLDVRLAAASEDGREQVSQPAESPEPQFPLLQWSPPSPPPPPPPPPP